MRTSYQHCVDRWYKLDAHEVQRQLVEDKIRFKVVPAGRRSGKTERAKRFLVRAALETPGKNFFAAAPTRAQAKQIFWRDLLLLSFSPILGDRAVSVSELSITFPNSSRIIVLGLDKPERFEGAEWGGGIVDEIGNVRPEAWAENIAPALDTHDPTDPDYRAWCWLIGVPEGLNHYYDLSEYARTSGDKDWKLYTWPSRDILPPDLIAAAQRRMSARQFKQEYEASFETASGRIYDDYGDANYTKSRIDTHELLHWMHDFNYTPLSSAIGVRRNDGRTLYILDEIILTSAVARQSALEFVEKYKDHQNRKVMLYGDPAGRAGEKHGHPSDYTELCDVLRQNGWEVIRQVKPKAPAIKDRQNAVRSRIKTADGEISLYVNTQNAPYAHKGLATVQIKPGSTFLEQDGEYQHITTAIGYCVDHIWPISEKGTTIFTPTPPILQHWQ